MSKINLSPNYCSCTVNQARNLLDKTKNGIDPFCVISMGKEKFVTAVREKTSSPDWHEQCEMPIVDDAMIKLTIYHKNKSSLSKGDFIGRAYVSLRDLNDYDRVHTKWCKLTDKDGKSDKDRGEIEVSLQFYSKNNTTGSVLDLATKKKHLSLKDIRHSLSDKFKVASKHRKHDQQTSGNQLADQHHHLGGDDGSIYSVRRFPDDSTSESTSFMGSHSSLSSLPYNDTKQQKKKSLAPSSGFGSTMGSGTSHSSHRSITSDYETSSILDSASMYGGEETSTTSPSTRSQIQEQEQQHHIFIGDHVSSFNSSDIKTKQKPVPSPILSKKIPTDASNSILSPLSRESKRNTTITSGDIEAAFDTIHNNNNKTSIHKLNDYEMTSTSDSFSGLSTIKENLDKDDNIFSTNSSKQSNDEEIDFNNIITKINQTNDNQTSKTLTSDIYQSKSNQHFKEQQNSLHSRSNDIQTPSASISIKPSTNSSSSIALSKTKQFDNTHDSTDEDVDELLGKFERISSTRSSVRRKIQPRDDIMQQSFSENENKGPFGSDQTSRNRPTTLPDIIGEPSVKGSSPHKTSEPRKLVHNGLCVLGYDNVKSVPINPKVRQELDYLDREELLHVIAYQTELLRKRDTRVKDLEHYADGLLVKIVEQCPNILQNGTIKLNRK
ncbi:unnamed protein product [Rotaria magnacalcarata]|uniref:Uncharacterized protein n=1 Tax=Rotaria magnacalcarata TaxID=392030 RepID=A0A816ZRC4_9BILA|nr:unnamed protein product [Rotaria magnacalcarata]CAF1528178.1 unnamed protein product [Rotaria magnacalcarata]CAF2208889.1 unnamed protein product [Rotaria magnacalcarata]